MGRRIRVVCPYCKQAFYVDVPLERRKGAGAHYAKQIKKLSPLHEEILQLLAEYGPCTKRRLGGLLAQRGRRISGNSLSGRLSELLGMGLVKCYRTEVREVDPETKKFRFVKKPVWELTEKGVEYILFKLGIDPL
ncbi:MAG: hypothetical protein DRJ67_06355 [Thermoprotei archaeon]|nr:MAG: hypothetical protein DRJ67_06355 [Thermoprotei archaeon]